MPVTAWVTAVPGPSPGEGSGAAGCCACCVGMAPLPREWVYRSTLVRSRECWGHPNGRDGVSSRQVTGRLSADCLSQDGTRSCDQRPRRCPPEPRSREDMATPTRAVHPASAATARSRAADNWSSLSLRNCECGGGGPGGSLAGLALAPRHDSLCNWHPVVGCLQL